MGAEGERGEEGVGRTTHVSADADETDAIVQPREDASESLALGLVPRRLAVRKLVHLRRFVRRCVAPSEAQKEKRREGEEKGRAVASGGRAQAW